MKDYSLNDIERKDFVLDYKVTNDGKIIVNLAKGEPLILPYNKQNEQILLNKMESQVNIASNNESKYIKNKNKYLKWFYRMLGSIAISTGIILVSDISFVDSFFGLIFSFSTIYGVISISQAIHMDNILDDLKRNKRFIEIKDKVNNNIKSDKNVLVNVSCCTKAAIKNASDKKPIFNINSFDKYPYGDFETIIDNLDRNERFGFDYTEPRKSKGPVKKRTR